MKLNLLYGILFLVMQKIPSDDAYNILALFPHPGISHFYFFQPLLKELAKKGHNLTVVSHFPEKTPIENYSELILSKSKVLKEEIELSIFEIIGKPPLIPSYLMLHNWGLEACENTLKSEEIKKILDPNTKYDLVLLEQFNSDCMLSIAYLKQAPVIGLSSSGILPWHYDRMNSPFITSYMPDIFLGTSEQMNLWSRFNNWYYYHLANLMYRYITQPATNKLIRNYLNESVPDVETLTKQIKLLLINQHFSFSGLKPWSPSVVEVSGLQIHKPKRLPDKFQNILDSSKSGVIYISWGSLIRSDTLSVAKRDSILKALSRFNQTVLWKWENESIPNCPENVHVFKWMPQQDILSHPNVKVFMNHGGLLGTTESVYNGVPMVTTPIMGDQFYNAAAIEHRKIGVILPFAEITEENVYNALKKVLNSEYQINAKVVAEIFKSRPDTPLNTATWWIEHVARMKGTILTESIVNNLPWYIYYCYDVYAVLLCAAVFIYYIIKLFIKLLIIIRKMMTKKEKKN